MNSQNQHTALNEFFRDLLDEMSTPEQAPATTEYLTKEEIVSAMLLASTSIGILTLAIQNDVELPAQRIETDLLDVANQLLGLVAQLRVDSVNELNADMFANFGFPLQG